MQLVLLGGNFETEDIARRLLAGGHEIYLDSRDTSLLKRLGYVGRVERMETQEALGRLSEPRVVWSTELSGRQLRELAEHLPAGTILVNSRAQYFEDNIQITDRLAKKGGHYIDVGAMIDDHRLALFVGGDPQVFLDVEPLLAAIAGKGSYYHCGPSGAGHFLRCMQQKYEVQVHSALASIISEIRRSPFNEEINLEAFLIFGHLFCKKQPLPDSVWNFLITHAHAAVCEMQQQGETVV
ncbi:MAG: NAD(P)-binding domain-containing protein [Desulfocurvibacter africanus]